MYIIAPQIIIFSLLFFGTGAYLNEFTDGFFKEIGITIIKINGIIIYEINLARTFL